MAEHLPIIYKTLGSNQSTTKKKWSFLAFQQKAPKWV
jgi:hypothetical protein